MAYNLRITKHAEELLDRLVYYLLYRLKNEQAARHLLDSINDIYERLEENPLQFPICCMMPMASALTMRTGAFDCSSMPTTDDSGTVLRIRDSIARYA